MVVQHDPARRYTPLRLLRNTTYPTYQLYAIAGSGKASPQAVLTIAVLETMGWLRSRFRDLDVPSELITPDSSAYASFDLKALQSFRIDMGYKVEVVWLPDDQIWTLQLTEPDLGSHPGEANQERPPVPGRMFETNIAYRIHAGQVECGFRTVVSDPEGTTAACEVYRLALIKHLVRNPLVGLKQGWPIIDKAHHLNRIADLNSLYTWLKDRERMMLAVIVAESINTSESEQPMHPGRPEQSSFSRLPPQPTLEDLKRDAQNLPSTSFTSAALYSLPPASALPSHDKFTLPNLRAPAFDWLRSVESSSDEQNPAPAVTPTARSAIDLLASPSAAVQHQTGEWLINIQELAHYKMGYAQIFALPLDRLDDFERIVGHTMTPGDILLIEPLAFGGEVERILRQQVVTDTTGTWQRLNDRIQNTPKGKPMTFGSVHFLPAAKEIEQTNRLRLHLSNRELEQASNERAKAAEQRHRSEVQSMQDHNRLLEERINRLQDRIMKHDAEKEQLRADFTALDASYQRQLAEKDREIMRLQALMCRPKNLDGIIPWAEQYLSEGLTFHARAKREMSTVAPGEVDIDLLCDALEYLATDYRDELMGLIDEDECRSRCSRKYNRGFSVSKLTGTSIGMYASQYKIKYYPGHHGKAIDSVLDLHLRVGNTNENLLRIYFLYDKDKKQLVIGSLPRHLDTVSYR